MDDQAFAEAVTRVMALGALIRPDLVTGRDPAELRGIASACYVEELRKDRDLPEPFRKAFE